MTCWVSHEFWCSTAGQGDLYRTGISIAFPVRSLDRSYREIITGGFTTASFDSCAFAQLLPLPSPADNILTPSSILRVTFSGLAPSRNATFTDSQAFFTRACAPRHLLRVRRVMSVRQTERKSHVPGAPFSEGYAENTRTGFRIFKRTSIFNL